MADSLVDSMQRLRLEHKSLKTLAPGDLFREVWYKLESAFSQHDDGDRAYSGYKGSGWTTETYETPGFARKYVSKKFESRCAGVFQFLQTLNQQFIFDFDNAQIIDIGAGPGCGAVAAAKFLLEIRACRASNPLKATLLDPVKAWSEASGVLNEFGILAKFKQSVDLEAMVSSELRTSLDEDGAPVLLVVSHVLQDFGGDPSSLSKWWCSLAQALHGRRALVLVLERSPCEQFLPKSLPDGGHLFTFQQKEPAGHEDTSYGAAIFLPKGSVQRKMRASISSPSQSSPPLPAPSSAPRCPECGGRMKVRVNKKGCNPGSKFYGCANYPACKGTRQV